jgi:hypothetical protein
MSLIFTDQLEKPSEIIPLPSNLIRPVFGALYGFDVPTDEVDNALQTEQGEFMMTEQEEILLFEPVV